MSSTLALDILIAALLLVTALYCWRLSKKLTVLHNSRDQLNTFIADFNNAIEHAQSSVTELKEVGESNDKTLREHIQKARFLANDLTFLMNKGENVAEVLENQISVSKAVSAQPMSAVRKQPAAAQNIPQYPPLSATDLPKATKSEETKPAPTIELRPAPVQPQNIVQHNVYSKALDSSKKDEPATSEHKKKALDDVFAQIARRKKEANNPSLIQQKTATEQGLSSEQPAQMQQAPPEQAITTGAIPSLKGQPNPFDKKRLSDTFLASQSDT